MAVLAKSVRRRAASAGPARPREAPAPSAPTIQPARTDDLPAPPRAAQWKAGGAGGAVPVGDMVRPRLALPSPPHLGATQQKVQPPPRRSPHHSLLSSPASPTDRPPPQAGHELDEAAVKKAKKAAADAGARPPELHHGERQARLRERAVCPSEATRGAAGVGSSTGGLDWVRERGDARPAAGALLSWACGAAAG